VRNFVPLVWCLSTVIGASSAQTPPSSNAFPGLRLSLDELKGQYQHTYVSKRLKPKKWPNGARVAVALSFDIDNASATLARGIPGSEPMSRGQYGAIDGLPRILRLLDKENVPASFFVPAVSAALNSEMIPLIQSKKRHEIGIHGWIHENLVELNDEVK
jgi:peptidoglycan-N-acetylglucosamine deacetylase